MRYTPPAEHDHDKRITVSFVVDQDQAEFIYAMAKRRRASRSFVMREAIECLREREARTATPEAVAA